MPRRSSRVPTNASSSSAPPSTRAKAKAKAKAKAPFSAPSPLVFPSDVLTSIFGFLGAAEDLGAASRVDKGWKAAADGYWTRQENQEEPWVSMLCARFSTEVMGPIVEVMKEKKDWVKVQEEEQEDDKEEEEEEDDDDDEGFYDEDGYYGDYYEGPGGYYNASDSDGDEDTAGTLLFLMTPKDLWYKSCQAHQNPKRNKTRGKAPVPAQFKSPFPGMFLRIELREWVKGKGGVGQLLGYRTFPFADDKLLLGLYDKGVSLVETVDELPDVRLRLTLTLVDLVGERVEKLVESSDAEYSTQCYGFTPPASQSWGDAGYFNDLQLDLGFDLRVKLMVFLMYAEESELQEFGKVDEVKKFVRGALM